MSARESRPLVFHPQRGDADFAARLRRVVAGDVLFDRASRGRYSTDASIYQIMPVGVLVPKRMEDVGAALQLCREHAVPRRVDTLDIEGVIGLISASPPSLQPSGHKAGTH